LEEKIFYSARLEAEHILDNFVGLSFRAAKMFHYDYYMEE